jgi:hypothetical protein
MHELDQQIAELRLNPSEHTASSAQRPGTFSTVAAQRQERDDA